MLFYNMNHIGKFTESYIPPKVAKIITFGEI